MLGTIVNALAIVLGSVAGLAFGQAIPERLKRTMIQGVGLAVLLIGISMALQTKNLLIVIGSLVLGGALGAWIDIELRLQRLGAWLEYRLDSSGDGRFTKAFVSTSLIYCVGAMAIMGSLESGLKGNHSILFAKAALDGISALVFASSMGLGVVFSAVPVFIYQGIITFSAFYLQGLLSAHIVAEMSATGGLLILGIGLNILEIKEIKVGNLLPGIFLAIPLTILLTKYHIGG